MARFPPAAPADDDDTDDAALFRAAIGAVKPLPAPPPPPAPPKPKPRARMAERDEDDARSEFQKAMAQDILGAGDVSSYRREQFPAAALKRLRNGEYSIEDELDLHGATAAQAEPLLKRFLTESMDAAHHCVRVIHGKGHDADGGMPILKNLVDRVLRHRSDVLAFHSAPPKQGGTGAVLVLLGRVRRE